ncbi:cytoplasmic dynein 2 intermediate chain 1 [Rhinophrynus dorsalis]
MAVALAELRLLHQVKVIPYLDDILILESSKEKSIHSTHLCMQFLTNLGWIINLQKRALSPSQKIIFVGIEFDTIQGKDTLSLDTPHLIEWSKNKEDTWKSEELARHLKAPHSERQGDDKSKKDRRHRRDEDLNEQEERRYRNGEEKRRHKNREDRDEQEARRHRNRGDRDEQEERRHTNREDQGAHEERRHRTRDGDQREHEERTNRNVDGDRREHEERRHRNRDEDRREHEERRDRNRDGDRREHEERRDRNRDGDRREHEERRNRTRDGERREHEERRNRNVDGDRREHEERRDRNRDGDRREHEERRDRNRDEERRHRNKDKERKEEREHHKYQDSERNADKDTGDPRNHRKEKDKVRDREREREREKSHHTSEKHRTGEREKARETRYSGERPSRLSDEVKELGETGLGKEDSELKRRETKDSVEKDKQRSNDREKRHQERKEKETKKREKEHYDERAERHRRRTEDPDMQDLDRERRRSERKHGENAEREKRHQDRKEETYGVRQLQSSKENSLEPMDVVENSRERQRSLDEDREKRHKERKEKKEQPSEGKERVNEEIENEDPASSTEAAYDDSTNYEEDFEDYDDDFESGSDEDSKEPVKPQVNAPPFKNPEIEAIQKAMILENEKIASFPSVQKQKVFSEQPKQGLSYIRTAHRGVFIDFGSAKQRQVTHQIASKQKKRSADILRLVDLDFSTTVSLLDLPPVKEYEMYIRNFGRTNTKQAYVQCNEDNVDREVQTEEIDNEEKWTQHPGEGAVACGGQKHDAYVNATTVTKVDSQRLAGFLRSACQVIAVLIEEDRAEKQSDCKFESELPCMSISDGCFQLNTNLPFLHDRPVSNLHFSQVQRHILLTVHGSCANSGSVRLDNKYIICVWNIWEPSTPQKVLICESEVKCCCFSPAKASLVFAGTVDGSVAVWDLREDLNMHHTMNIADTNWTFRSATFSTDGVFTNINHTSPVKAIEPVPSTVYKDHGISSVSSHDEVSGFSFQIASLDETGHLILWVVVELRKGDVAGSQSDLGLIPGGKIKLVHSSSIHLNGSFFSKDVISLGPPETLNIKFLPQDSNHFVIGTDIGLITHGTRYGLLEPPKQYKPLHSKMRPSRVTSIDFSPFGIPAFLAGCSDGCIRLHIISADFPARQWNDSTDGQSVTAVQWALTRPTVFFVLDAAYCIYIWDLMQNDLQPIAKESMRDDQVLSVAVLGEPEKNNGLMGLAVAKTSGKVEIQYIKKKWAKPQPRELEKLDLILNGIL